MIKRIIAVLLCVILSFALASCAVNPTAEKEENDNKADTALVFDAFDMAYSSYDASTVSAYSDLCSAVYNGETEVRMNVGMFNDVLQLFYTSYPLNVLVGNIAKKEDKSGITIEYKQSTEETVAKSKAFSDKVNQILDECGAGKVNNKAFAVKAYNYVAKNVKSSDKDGLTAYDTIMTGEGDSFTASNMLEYLLRQGGVKSAHILATDYSGAGWGVTLAELDNVNYLFDPMTEQIANGGTQLCYFGMTNEEAKAEGLNELVYTNRSTVPVCDNPYFDSCRNSKAWEMSEDGNSLLITKNDDNIVE
ncbi:MAG: hypothetical protein IKF64_04045, partial [Eubacterium sp.]|nr:hypothetical protein [Eubacterium sp.]